MARFLAEYLPPAYRVPIWLTGGALIFIGLAVLSIGSQHHQQADEDDSAAASEPTAAIEAPRGPCRDKDGNSSDAVGDGAGVSDTESSAPRSHKRGGAGEGNRTLA